MKARGLVALLLVCLVLGSAALPWEELLRFREKARLEQQTHKSKRAISAPPCPVHPGPVPQSLINQRFLPEGLHNATTRIKEQLQKEMVSSNIATASVGIVYDQALIWEQGFGLINPSDPSSHVNADTIFRIGSVTKLITNMMLFKLRDEGKLALDDPISKYVPELTWQSPFKNNPGITWRTLAGQTSGLTGTTPCNFFTLLEPVLGDACDISNAEAWKRVTAQMPSVPMWQDPHYADGAYAIIGRALESVVGMSWEDYIVQHIFKPLGMESTYVTYDAWSDMAKRVPPGKVQNKTLPGFVSHVDLRWARPTGNVYSTVRDLAKLASVFMVGDGESKNALGLFTSTIREMLTPSFVNDEHTTAYGYPFEIYHSSVFGDNLPQYWVRTKGGSMPGYYTILSLFPEIKTALIMQSSGFYPVDWNVPISELLVAMEQTLWDLQPLPSNPGNLTEFEGSYAASMLLGLISANVSVTADLQNNKLAFKFQTGGAAAGKPEIATAVWVNGNSFRMLPDNPTMFCLGVESGLTNVIVHFKTEEGWFGNDPARVVALEIPSDPFYGWVFARQ